MYTKNEWQNGDVITKSKLDHAEDGIYAASFIPQVSGSVDESNAVTLDPNKFYVFGEEAEIDVSFAAGTEGQVNEYHFSFVSGTTPTVLSLPLDVVMPDSFSVEAYKTYEISVINNKGLYASWTEE